MWAHFIQSYGYWAVFIGTLLEGETILILAGFSVSLGYLEFLPVLLLATAGGMLGDATYFLLGRRYGPRMIRRFPGLRRMRARAVLFLRRWGRFAAFMTRFAYGLRIVLPITMGAARMRPALFFTFNLMGAFSFVLFYLTLGYLFGEAMEELLGRVRPYERWIVAGLIATGLTVWVVRKWRLYRSSPQDVQAAAAALRASRAARRLERERVENEE
jgi:membrane protein DedA with SNARE-associated domain